MNSILEISDKKPFYGGLCGPGLRKAVAAIIRRAGLVHSGESCLTESSQVVGSKQPLRRFCGGKACLGFSLPQTPLMWEPLALGLPFFFQCQTLILLQSKHNHGRPKGEKIQCSSALIWWTADAHPICDDPWTLLSIDHIASTKSNATEDKTKAWEAYL